LLVHSVGAALRGRPCAVHMPFDGGMPFAPESAALRTDVIKWNIMVYIIFTGEGGHTGPPLRKRAGVDYLRETGVCRRLRVKPAMTGWDVFAMVMLSAGFNFRYN